MEKRKIFAETLKKVTATVTATAVVVMFAGTTAGKAYTCEAATNVQSNVWGDVNRDGKVSTVDAKDVLDYSVEEMIAIPHKNQEFNLAVANVDGVGKITSSDAKLILDRAVAENIGLKVRFPVEAGFEKEDKVQVNKTWSIWKDTSTAASSAQGFVEKDSIIEIIDYVGGWWYQIRIKDDQTTAFVYITYEDEKFFEVIEATNPAQTATEVGTSVETTAQVTTAEVRTSAETTAQVTTAETGTGVETTAQVTTAEVRTSAETTAQVTTAKVETSNETTATEKTLAENTEIDDAVTEENTTTSKIDRNQFNEGDIVVFKGNSWNLRDYADHSIVRRTLRTNEKFSVIIAKFRETYDWYTVKVENDEEIYNLFIDQNWDLFNLVEKETSTHMIETTKVSTETTTSNSTNQTTETTTSTITVETTNTTTETTVTATTIETTTVAETTTATVTESGTTTEETQANETTETTVANDVVTKFKIGDKIKFVATSWNLLNTETYTAVAWMKSNEMFTVLSAEALSGEVHRYRISMDEREGNPEYTIVIRKEKYNSFVIVK